MSESPAPAIRKRGGCRPGMSGCGGSCGHRRMVQEYRLAREAAELAREAATGAYSAELAEYGPIITFKQWLRNTAGASF